MTDDKLTATEFAVPGGRGVEREEERFGDCGDNSCAFAVERGGMRTNGGCRCLNRLSIHAEDAKGWVIPRVKWSHIEHYAREVRAALAQERQAREETVEAYRDELDRVHAMLLEEELKREAAERERDEAVKSRNWWAGRSESHYDRLAELRDQRDEARAELEKARDWIACIRECARYSGLMKLYKAIDRADAAMGDGQEEY